MVLKKTTLPYPCRLILLIFLLSLVRIEGTPQDRILTRQDTLRGSITPERAWWDLTYYHLSVQPDPGDSTIRGTVSVHYRVVSEANRIQIDLQPPLVLLSAKQDGQSLDFTPEGNVIFIKLLKKQVVGDLNQLVLTYSGRPKISKNPPWDGGIAWRTDDTGNPFFATACQGAGASTWWPCKDHMYDEPDSMLISITVPENLMAVSNGRLRATEKDRKVRTKTFHWFVSSPISNYVVNMNVGMYSHFGETYPGEAGLLDCDYYVLSNHLAQARKHFSEVPRMLEAFEYWFGPYPFYADGYKLVEVSYPGMEHQSSVTYGNRFQNGFYGVDLSSTGWGSQFDFIIVHESAHEWFANNITYCDIADMWIHESFAAYSESLFTEYHFGKEAGAQYVRGTRANILNDRPIIGTYNVNREGSGDMYPKGANMLHMLRQIIDNDSLWRQILRGLNQEFYHQTVTTQQVEFYLARFTGLTLNRFFDQYLRDIRIPLLEYSFQGNLLRYRWSNCVVGFDMPVRVWLNDKYLWIYPQTTWKSFSIEPGPNNLRIDPNFYVAGLEI